MAYFTSGTGPCQTRVPLPACIVRVGKPTVRQIYALAAALCEWAGEGFPETREEASELIERLRNENGHPAPRLEDVPFRPRGRRRGRPPEEPEASRVASELAREML